jgi:peptidoglycan L-alanyl-D-glutamate endopeptidase CwlK
MPSFSKASKDNLATCHPDIQKVLNEAIKYVDFTVICGHRGQQEQDEAFAKGFSKIKWPNGKHNKFPSEAVDVAPYSNGIHWDDLEAFTYLAGIIKGISFTMGIKLRMGVDWDGDLLVKEHSFKDRPHIELVR